MEFKTIPLNDNILSKTIIKKMKGIFEPDHQTIRKIDIILKEGDKICKHWEGMESRKKLKSGKKTLFVILKPKDIKGFAILFSEQDEKTHIKWMYIPALGRVRKIKPIMDYDSFFGTDFTYSDIGIIDISGTHRIIDTEDYKDTKAYVVETIPQKQWYYSRIVSYISAENFLPIHRDYYDGADRLWKTQLFEEITVINNIPTPIRIQMIDLQEKTSTEYYIKELYWGQSVADKYFDFKLLPQAANAFVQPIEKSENNNV